MTDINAYSLNPADIDCSGEWLLHPENPAEKILPSMKKNGQLVPVLVAQDGVNTVLLAGRTRVRAAEKLGKKVFAVIIEAENEISKAVVHLEENSARSADDFLKVAAFRFFISRMEKKDVAGTLGPLLSIKSKSRDMNLWLDWMELEDGFDALLASGNIPLAAVSVLIKISAEDRAALKPFFEKVSWSRSNAVNFLTWLYETSRRENKSVVELVDGLEVARENESPKDAVARLCRSAKLLRYPHLGELEKEHSKIVSEICAGTKWKVESVGNFETGEVLLQTRFKSREVMRKALEDLEKIEKLDGWDTLFELGRDK